ncbi:unnamed protein product [Lymnaea stagnalis]|uniref:Uncharacterized protein n=1 Tax=Lymnaea stagnalis TaxID=6523 RepID=A0AAV2IHV2_LYMST
MGFPVVAGCLTKAGSESLGKSCSSRLKTLTVDVTDSDSIRAAYEAVKKALPDDTCLWAVVNNAGVTGRLTVSEMCTKKDFIDACNVNLFGPIEVARTFMPLLRKSKGRVVNMVSVMGRCPAVSSPYSVSKFGLEAYSDVLRREVSRFGVKVIVIEPGFFKTTIFNREALQASTRKTFEQSSSEVQAAYGHDYVEKMSSLLDGVMDSLSPHTYKVVNAYVDAITAKYPRARYLVGYDAKFLFVPIYHLPEWLMDWLIEFKSRKLIQKTTS